ATPDPNTPAACAARRARLAAELGEGLLLVAAGPEGEGRFEADPDFHWLTGLDAPDAVLLLLVEGGAPAEERLYLRAASETRTLWEGAALAPGPEAVRRTGIATTLPTSELDTDVDLLLVEAPRLWVTGDASRALLAGRELAPDDPRPVLSRLQATKSPGEQAALRTAVDVTLAALADAFVVAVPGAWEYTAEAAVEAGFRRRGAEFRAFPSICASGPNGCALHYRANGRRLASNDLLILDVGARYHGYCADVTRTIPTSGRFTPRQRELYELVLATQKKCEGLLKPGATLDELHQAAQKSFADAGYGEAFRHYVGHHLGIRTHDARGFRGPLEPGMVVTIEPGLYLPDEGLGIRIEDDYLLTEDGAEKLSAALPSDPDRLEAYLARLRR
ncbi:MAG: aminopeptidase P family protein, partial [Planctomycetes bacterium]|nr:aminopeptidase P family protein [Planctomycetota bacterium]